MMCEKIHIPCEGVSIFEWMNKGYDRTVSLRHNETLLKRDNETGEITDVKTRPNNIPEGKEVFAPDALFSKDYKNSWRFLLRQLTPIEFKAAHSLALLAKANTNSLEPLNDDTVLTELMEVLQVSINKVRPILNKLFDLGVYGRFEAKQVNKAYTKYWLLNPYLSFSGKLIKSDIAELFKDTHIAKAFYDPDYGILKLK